MALPPSHAEIEKLASIALASLEAERAGNTTTKPYRKYGTSAATPWTREVSYERCDADSHRPVEMGTTSCLNLLASIPAAWIFKFSVAKLIEIFILLYDNLFANIMIYAECHKSI